MKAEKATILLVEDETRLQLVLKQTLELYGYTVVTAIDGKEGYKNFHRHRPDLAILDIMLPGLDGYALLKEIRKKSADIPVILLTAKSQTADLVKGFEYGANDYIKKPFIIDELLARIKALLSRKAQKETQEAGETYKIGSFEFRYSSQELSSEAGIIQLTYKDAEILRRLAANVNAVVEAAPLLIDLWGDDNFYTARTLNVYITRLRNYLKEDEQVQVLNVRSIGFKLIVKNK